MTIANPTEADVKDKVVKILKQHGWFVFRPAASQFGTTGVSDILALRAGIFLAVETKLKKKTASAHQEAFQQKVRDHGAYAVVVNMARLEKFRNLVQLLTAEGDQDASASVL